MTREADVIYVGEFHFPNGDGAAARVAGIGKALRDADYSVAFAGLESAAVPEDIQADGSACRDGMYYYPARNFDGCKFARWRRGLNYHLTGATTFDRLRRIVTGRTRAIIAYHGLSTMLLRLMNFCRKRKIALINDCTEWYDPHHILWGSLGPFRWDFELRMHWIQPEIGNMIAISSYLERYYRGRGCRVVRVPPLVDLQASQWKPVPDMSGEEGELNLMYAGTPGKKDLLPNALKAVIKLRAEGFPIKVHLLGATRNELGRWMRHDPAFVDALGDAVIFYGRIPQQQVWEMLPKSDFTILLREDKRYAHAGFPTKLVESLSAGVPIITNPTSDIPQYVRDGQEGILLENHSPEAFAAGVRRIFQMPRSKWREMRFHARRRAEESFDYRRYISTMKDFLEQACGENKKEQHGNAR
jgi:glycosyltransferase involved in cell wall biosynthesis